MKSCIAWLLLLCAGVPQFAAAAPFCVAVQGIPPQCLYVDARDCQTRATRLGGICTLNPTEIISSPGPGKFCLVESSQVTLCVYASRTLCEAEATRRRSACVPASAPAQQGVDPYEIRRPY